VHSFARFRRRLCCVRIQSTNKLTIALTTKTYTAIGGVASLLIVTGVIMLVLHRKHRSNRPAPAVSQRKQTRTFSRPQPTPTQTRAELHAITQIAPSSTNNNAPSDDAAVHGGDGDSNASSTPLVGGRHAVPPSVAAANGKTLVRHKQMHDWEQRRWLASQAKLQEQTAANHRELLHGRYGGGEPTASSSSSMASPSKAVMMREQRAQQWSREAITAATVGTGVLLPSHLQPHASLSPMLPPLRRPQTAAPLPNIYAHRQQQLASPSKTHSYDVDAVYGSGGQLVYDNGLSFANGGGVVYVPRVAPRRSTGAPPPPPPATVNVYQPVGMLSNALAKAVSTETGMLATAELLRQEREAAVRTGLAIQARSRLARQHDNSDGDSDTAASSSSSSSSAASSSSKKRRPVPPLPVNASAKMLLEHEVAGLVRDADDEARQTILQREGDGGDDDVGYDGDDGDASVRGGATPAAAALMLVPMRPSSAQPRFHAPGGAAGVYAARDAANKYRQMILKRNRMVVTNDKHRGISGVGASPQTQQQQHLVGAISSVRGDIATGMAIGAMPTTMRSRPSSAAVTSGRRRGAPTPTDASGMWFTNSNSAEGGGTDAVPQRPASASMRMHTGSGGGGDTGGVCYNGATAAPTYEATTAPAYASGYPQSLIYKVAMADVTHSNDDDDDDDYGNGGNVYYDDNATMTTGASYANNGTEYNVDDRDAFRAQMDSQIAALNRARAAAEAATKTATDAAAALQHAKPMVQHHHHHHHTGAGHARAGSSNTAPPLAKTASGMHIIPTVISIDENAADDAPFEVECSACQASIHVRASQQTAVCSNCENVMVNED
jgi:hypothetical protein